MASSASGTRSGLDGAAVLITTAARELEELGEAEEWSVAHQKLVLTYRGAGGLGRAQRLIAVARDSGTDDTPLQCALDHGYITVLEGILYVAHYGEMVARLRDDHPGRSLFYYLDVPFEENPVQAPDQTAGQRVRPDRDEQVVPREGSSFRRLGASHHCGLVA